MTPLPVLAVVAKLMMMPPPPPPVPVMQLDLRQVFPEHPMVQRVARDGRLGPAALEFLLREAEPLDARLAVASPHALADVAAAGDEFSRAAFGGLPLAKITGKTGARADLLLLAAYLSAARAGGSSPHARSLAAAAVSRAPKSFVTAMLAAMMRADVGPSARPCDAARLLLAPLRDPALVTDVEDRALFALADVAYPPDDACRAQTPR